MHQSENESEILVPRSAKMSVVRRSPDGSAPSCSKDQTELVVRGDGKEASPRSPLRAPLGVPLCPVSIGGARRALPPASSSRCIGALDDGALLDSLNIKGTDGADCFSTRSCIELVGSRSGHESTKNNTNKHHSYMKLINGVRPGHQYQMQNSGKPPEVEEQRNPCEISLQDFRVAMELNPRKLGEDWPLLLEKICTHAFEE
ncbi:UNVERIFIED_CONTAM: hypothetical protein Scaly_0166300 [Sesamum calycinum]|uniref:Uncharacterized protein n=1 Tax=Sesamum calycinum TaxID=2727403 RepID=A0AAW2SX69_9LAMI